MTMLPRPKRANPDRTGSGRTDMINDRGRDPTASRVYHPPEEGPHDHRHGDPERRS
jgi:hypothetical protein